MRRVLGSAHNDFLALWQNLRVFWDGYHSRQAAKHAKDHWSCSTRVEAMFGRSPAYRWFYGVSNPPVGNCPRDRATELVIR